MRPALKRDFDCKAVCAATGVEAKAMVGNYRALTPNSFIVFSTAGVQHWPCTLLLLGRSSIDYTRPLHVD